MRPFALVRLLAVAVSGGLTFSGSPGLADEVSDAQKRAAAANLKKAEIDNAAVVETEHFIVCATIPEAKAKQLGAQLEKVYATARKALRFEPADSPWKGKLTVYHLTDRRDFNLFARAVVGERPTADYFVGLRRDDPFVVDGVGLGEKAAEADRFGQTGALVGSAVLQGKMGGTEVPEWVRMGFGRSASLRAEGPNSKRLAAYKARARRAVLAGAGGRPVPVGAVWNESGTPDQGTLATCLMDYLAYGPGSAKLLDFLNGFRPNENVQNPGVAQALEAAMWKEPALDAAWKKWVQAGLPVK
jgi:hypothetical protein